MDGGTWISAMAEWDKDLMVLRLFSGREQRGHRLSNSTGTDRATRLWNVRFYVCSLPCISYSYIILVMYNEQNNYTAYYLKSSITSFVYLLHMQSIHSYVKKVFFVDVNILCSLCVFVCFLQHIYVSRLALFWLHECVQTIQPKNFTPAPRHLYQSHKKCQTNAVSVGWECLHTLRGERPRETSHQPSCAHLD